MASTEADKISFVVNGQRTEVSARDVAPDLSLARFLRERLHLTGTKLSCDGEGGCGACQVTARIPDVVSVKGVNACLIPVLSCAGWSVTTVEGLGSTRAGLNPIQERLAAFHGTQCGFCSPGMVMAMNSLKESTTATLDQKTIENQFDGNICRCTGYRPILDAFKSFAGDAPEHLKKKVADIEDMVKQRCTKPCKVATNGHCSSDCGAKAAAQNGVLTLKDGTLWHQPGTMDELLVILKGLATGQTYRLVAGNTGTGVFDEGRYAVYVDINRIKELKTITRFPLALGGGVSLCDAIVALEAESDPKYEYAETVATHWRKVANAAVRNVGTIAGNLMLKHAHNDFPSDIFVVLEALDAKIEVTDKEGRETSYSPAVWLKQSMDGRVLKRVVMPELTATHVFKSYKISPRSQNSHAYVNAAFLAKIDPASLALTDTPRLVYGGVSAEFVHAVATENFLSKKSFKDVDTLKGALKCLEGEVIPNDDPAHASVAYRKHLTKALLYKFALAILGDKASGPMRSGALQITREVSRGEQFFQTDPLQYPVNEPIAKLEGKIQCTGEAEYVGDTPPLPNEVFGAFVLSGQGNCELASVDAAAALAMPGVVAFLDHADVPGANNASSGRHKEEIFCSGKVHYAGQSVGLVVAESFEVARRAAKLVRIQYKNVKKPVLSIRQAIKEQERMSTEAEDLGAPAVSVGELDVFQDDIEKSFSTPVKTVQGEVEIGSQYHFHLETQTCIVRPIEDGQFEILSATQWIANTQNVVAAALNLPRNNFDMKVRRLGGAFGGKISQCSLTAAAAAIAANKLNRPVRITLDLKTNMEMVGKRLPYLAKYKAVVSADGDLKAVGIKLYCDCGYTFNEATAGVAASFAQNCYSAQSWRISPTAVVTNTPSNTYVRAPGSTQAVAAMEHVIEHVATELGLDPLEVRVKNMLKSGDSLVGGWASGGKVGTFEESPSPATIIVDQVKNSSGYSERKTAVAAFNQSNRWKKRGLSLVPIRYAHDYWGPKYHVMVSVYSGDGTVVVSHGGIEMGQGLNTKVAQVVAKELGIDVSMIKFRPSNNLVGPNNDVTGGCMGSECCASGAQFACQELKTRMKPVKDKMSKPDASWLDVVKACDAQAIDLSARHMAHSGNDGLKNYVVWGAVVTEVELDVLTGEMKIRRADLVEDTGAAISPEVDVGQVEGGFVMGLGLWLTENLRYDDATGRLMSRSTWDYYPPASHDVPEDMRTTFYNSGNNPNGVLGSKATGEPSVLMGVGVMFAIRNALNSARKDAGFDPKMWYNLNGPATVENIQQSGGISADYFTI